MLVRETLSIYFLMIIRIRVTGSICRQLKDIYTYYLFCFPSGRLYLLIHSSLLSMLKFFLAHAKYLEGRNPGDSILISTHLCTRYSDLRRK